MLAVYPACFFKEGTKYSVIFPDLNWLSTCGDSLADAMSMAIDCLAGYLYSSKQLQVDVPKPSDYHTVNLSKIASELELDTQDAFVNMISVDVNTYAKKNFEKAVKKTLTIPAWLNKVALEQNINFSQVLQDALIKKVQMH